MVCRAVFFVIRAVQNRNLEPLTRSHMVGEVQLAWPTWNPTVALAKRTAISIRAICTAFRNHRVKPILAAIDIFCRNVNPKVFIIEPRGIDPEFCSCLAVLASATSAPIARVWRSAICLAWKRVGAASTCTHLERGIFMPDGTRRNGRRLS